MVRWCDISQKRTMRTWFTIYFGKSKVVWIKSLQKFTLRNNVKKKTMIEWDGLHRSVEGKEGGDLMGQLAKQEKQILKEHLGQDH